MTDITLPYWLFVILAGAPVLFLLGLVIKAIRNIRKGTAAEIDQINQVDHPVPPMTLTHMDNSDFQNDLNALQIDAVFNTLTALLETERIKLKGLLCPSLNPASATPRENSPVDSVVPKLVSNETKGISQQIAERAAAGESAGAIANALGISCSEVELSISMSEGDTEERPARLEAVA
jgi:hypothetical protein